jgi:hypothetical protein
VRGMLPPESCSEANGRAGSKASISSCPRHVCFAPHSDRKADAVLCRLCANFCRERSQAHSAGRWYLRSWSREHNDFRDYNLNRISAVGDHRASPVDPALDFEWIHKINLVIVPNPGLSPQRQAAVATEYAMEGGRLVRPCRLSLSFYLMSEYNLDVELGVLKPEKQQIILQNRDEVTQV